MTLYVSDAWKKYRENLGMLVAVSFVVSVFAAISLITQHAAVKGILNLLTSFVSTIGIIYAYQRIIGTYKDPKAALSTAALAWLAQMLLGIILTILMLISIAFLFIPTIGWIITLVAVFAILIFAAKFIYIPYLAAKGNSFEELFKKSWNAKLSVAISAIFCQLIVGILIGIIVIPVLIPAFKSVASMATTMGASWAILSSPEVLVSFAAAWIIYTILAPWIWMFPLVSGKDAVGE